VPRLFTIGEQFENDDGQPLVNGKLKFEISGGGGDKDTFADPDLKIVNPNPYILSGAGRLQTDIWFNGEAKVILFTSADVQIEVRDPIPGLGAAGEQFQSFNALITYNKPDIVVGSDERFYQSIDNGNIGNDPTTTSGFWMEVFLTAVFDIAFTYGIGQIVKASDSVVYVSLVTSNIGNDPTSTTGFWSTSLNPLLTDTINEFTLDNGVVIDGLTIKDGTPEGITVQGTQQSTSGGTEYDFPIPPWVTVIVCSYFAHSTNGISRKRIQIGDAGGIETSGYAGATSELTTVAQTAQGMSGGFDIFSDDAGQVLHGSIILTLKDAATFNWIASGGIGATNGTAISCAGGKSLSEVLTTVRFTTTNGTDVGDSGSVNVRYW